MYRLAAIGRLRRGDSISPACRRALAWIVCEVVGRAYSEDDELRGKNKWEHAVDQRGPERDQPANVAFSYHCVRRSGFIPISEAYTIPGWATSPK